MKILYISPRYRGGGAERCARELFHGMRERGHNTTMWTAVPEENTPPGVECIRTFAERLLFPVNYLDPVADWRHISARRRIDAIRPGDFDVVHLHNIHGHWMSIKALHRLCQRVPVVWTLHDEWAATGGVPYDLGRTAELREQLAAMNNHRRQLVPLSAEDSSAVSWNHFLSNWLPQPRCVIAPSRYMGNLTENSGCFPDKNICHLRNGLSFLELDTRHLNREQARRQWNLPTDARVLLFIASQLNSPYKGATLAQAMLNDYANRFQADQPLSLLLLGRSPESFLSRLDQRISVTTGYASTDEHLCAAYRAADVTLVPSIADNFPYVVLESFACETPVVAFQIGGLSEMLGNNERGLCIPPFKSREASGELRMLFSSSGRIGTLGVAARKWVEEFCDPHTYFQDLVHIYNDVVSGVS